MTAPMPPAPLVPPSPPWTPFPLLPNDNEPPIAKLWMRRLSEVMHTAQFFAQPPEWQQCLVQKYQAAVQVIQAVEAQQATMTKKPAQGQGAGTQPSQPTQPTQATQNAQQGTVQGVSG